MFRTCVPDRKWRQLVAALENKNEPMDPWIGQCYKVCEGTEKDDDIFEALRIISIPYHRNTVMALLLCRATHDEISQSLELTLPTIRNVELLLMDPDEIRHKLDHLDYIEEYIERYVEDEDEVALIRTGLTSGPYILLERLRLGHEVIVIDPGEMTKNIINTSYMLGMVARGNLITSEATKQSLQWFSKGVMGALTAVEKLELNTVAEESAIVAIQQRKETESLEEAGLNIGEILH